MPEERLQKILSRAGVASRRQAETLIQEGRVKVNGAVVTELGAKADLERDHIKVDERHIHAPKNLLYIALNKPNNVMTTVSDPEGRPTVMGLLRGVKERVYPVGRLDYHSEGLLLLTNDGELANAIMSTASHLPKTYVVKVNGELTEVQEQQFRDGVPLSGRRTLPAGLKQLHRAANSWYEIRLYEGRNNQIRMMFKHFSRLVEKLKRVKIGPVDLGPLKPGEFRHLDQPEVESLKRACARREKAPPVESRGPGASAPSGKWSPRRVLNRVASAAARTGKQSPPRTENRDPGAFAPTRKPSAPRPEKRGPGAFAPTRKPSAPRPEKRGPGAFARTRKPSAPRTEKRGPGAFARKPAPARKPGNGPRKRP